MNAKLILKTTLAFGALSFITACGGGDQRGRNNGSATFDGLWMSQSAFTDFVSAGPRFCSVATREQPTRHGLTRVTGRGPTVRILRITAEGTMLRWSESLNLARPQSIRAQDYVGRITAAGAPVAEPRRPVGPGEWRLTSPTQITQIAGLDVFRTRPNEGLRGAGIEPLDFQYTRINEDQARTYLAELRRCSPTSFPDSRRDPRDVNGGVSSFPEPSAPGPGQTPDRRAPVGRRPPAVGGPNGTIGQDPDQASPGLRDPRGYVQDAYPTGPGNIPAESNQPGEPGGR